MLPASAFAIAEFNSWIVYATIPMLTVNLAIPWYRTVSEVPAKSPVPSIAAMMCAPTDPVML